MNWTLRIVSIASTRQHDSVALKQDIDAQESIGYRQQLCGLTLPLRLALSAQDAGACCVQLDPELAEIKALLNDPRLHIPVMLLLPQSMSSSNTTSASVESAFDSTNDPNTDAFKEGVSNIESADDSLRVDVPWNAVVHRDLFKDLIAQANSTGQRGVRVLLEQPYAMERAFGFDPIVVHDKQSFSKARSALLRSLRKSQDGWTSTYINRHISLFLSRWLVSTSLRPNQISVVILLIGLAGAYLASTGEYWKVLLGAFCFNAQSVLDGCDGEVSRLTYRTSYLGQWLDTLGDDITNYAFFAALSWGLYVSTGTAIYLIAGAVVVSCGVVASGIEYRYLISIGSGDLLAYPLGIGKTPGKIAKSPKTVVGTIADGVSPLFKRDSFVLLTLFGVAAGLSGPFLFLFAAAAVAILVAVIRAEIRMARQRTTS